MNYIDTSLLFEFTSLCEQNDSFIGSIKNEATFILEGFTRTNVVMEAEGAKGGRIKSIVDFIKRLISRFLDKVNSLTKSNATFLKRNKDLLNSDEINKMNIEITPYWEQENPAAIIKNFMSAMDKEARSNNPMSEISEIKKKYLSKYTDDDGNLTNGLKNYLRTGKVNEETRKVRLSGSSLRGRLNSTMVPYVTDYPNKTRPITGELTRRIDSLKGIVSSELRNRDDNKTTANSTKSVSNDGKQTDVKVSKESYSELYGTDIRDTVIGAYLGIQYLSEAKTKKESATSVSVGKYETDAEQNKATNVKGESVDSLKSQETFLKILQTISAVVLTIMEEQYTAYMNAIRAITNSSKGGKSNSGDKESVDTTI